jgi:hypothetical protein
MGGAARGLDRIGRKELTLLSLSSIGSFQRADFRKGGEKGRWVVALITRLPMLKSEALSALHLDWLVWFTSESGDLFPNRNDCDLNRNYYTSGFFLCPGPPVNLQRLRKR